MWHAKIKTVNYNRTITSIIVQLRFQKIMKHALGAPPRQHTALHADVHKYS